MWTWTGQDADSRMILSYEIGDRSYDTAIGFISDLASRISNRVQLNTDGHKSYLEAVEEVFGSEIDYVQLIKIYGKSEDDEIRYSPSECIEIKKKLICGKPDMKELSTSYVERQNLSMRMGMRRFTRLTNGFSKKIQNHFHMLSLYFVHYNFVKIHKTLRVTPAMAADVTNELHDVEWIIGLIDAREEKPNRPKTYRKKAA